MKPATVDIRGWAKRNIWTNECGDMIVRPGLRRISSNESGRVIVAGFSVRNETNQEVWHYVFDVASTGAKSLKLRIYDEDFVAFQVFSINADCIPRGVTHAIVNGEIIIGSPDFPTLWGMVGSSVRYADSVASVSGSTALAVPRGIVVEWCDRVVIFNGRNMNVSDPIAVTGGSPRTYIAENQNQRPGIVYGAHEAGNGMLVCVTSAGVYGLDAGAAAVGVVGSNGSDWRLLHHAKAIDYDSSCVVRGRVYALTRGGWAIVDTPNDKEQILSEPVMPRATARIALGDYRGERMYAGEAGPIVGADGVNAIHMSDLSSDWPCASWWTTSSTALTSDGFLLRGILRMPDGDEALLTSNGVWLMVGNVDDDDNAVGSGRAPTAFLSGIVPTSPRRSRRVTHVHIGIAATGTSTVRAVNRGELKSISPPPDPEGIIIGTDDWTIATKLLTTDPITDVRFEFNRLPSRDIALEVSATDGTSRILPVIDLGESESTEERPTSTA